MLIEDPLHALIPFRRVVVDKFATERVLVGPLKLGLLTGQQA